MKFSLKASVKQVAQRLNPDLQIPNCEPRPSHHSSSTGKSHPSSSASRARARANSASNHAKRSQSTSSQSPKHNRRREPAPARTPSMPALQNPKRPPPPILRHSTALGEIEATGRPPMLSSQPPVPEHKKRPQPILRHTTALGEIQSTDSLYRAPSRASVAVPIPAPPPVPVPVLHSHSHSHSPRTPTRRTRANTTTTPPSPYAAGSRKLKDQVPTVRIEAVDSDSEESRPEYPLPDGERDTYLRHRHHRHHHHHHSQQRQQQQQPQQPQSRKPQNLLQPQSQNLLQPPQQPQFQPKPQPQPRKHQQPQPQQQYQNHYQQRKPYHEDDKKDAVEIEIEEQEEDEDEDEEEEDEEEEDEEDEDEEEATATCFCGAVQLAFPVQGPGLVSSFICNCADCKKLTAALFASNFTIRDEYLKHVRGRQHLKTYSHQLSPPPAQSTKGLSTTTRTSTKTSSITTTTTTGATTGATTSTPATANRASGHSMTSYFCEACGTLMYRIGAAFPKCSILRLGTVDDLRLAETKLKPTRELFVKDRVSWIAGVQGSEGRRK